MRLVYGLDALAPGNLKLQFPETTIRWPQPAIMRVDRIKHQKWHSSKCPICGESGHLRSQCTFHTQLEAGNSKPTGIALRTQRPSNASIYFTFPKFPTNTIDRYFIFSPSCLIFSFSICFFLIFFIFFVFSVLHQYPYLPRKIAFHLCLLFCFVSFSFPPYSPVYLRIVLSHAFARLSCVPTSSIFPFSSSSSLPCF